MADPIPRKPERTPERTPDQSPSHERLDAPRPDADPLGPLVKELLQDVRQGLPAHAWNAAVTANRQGEVAFVERQGDTFLYDVHLGRALPFRVELDLPQGDWTCSCRSRDSACAHVAAGLIALNRSPWGSASAATRSRPTDGPSLRHVLRCQADRWGLEAWVVDPGAPDQPSRLVGPPPPEVFTTPADRQVLDLTRIGLTGERLRVLLEGLAQCQDVRVDELPVRVSADPLRPAVVVEDHPRGMRVQLGPPDPILRRLPGWGELVVVGSPPTLRMMGSSSLPPHEVELYSRGRILAGDQATRFLAESLPLLRARTPVVMRSSIAQTPVSEQPYARLSLLAVEGGFDVLPSITYGRPPQAVVIRDQLHPLAGSRGLPGRQRDLERPHANHLARLGLEPGIRVQLRGLEAAAFADRVLVRFRGEVEGRSIAEARRLHSAPLQARWSVDPDTGQPVLRFELPGPLAPLADRADGSGGRATPTDGAGEAARMASPQAVVEAWREGMDLVPLLDGGFARLPSDWLGQYGAVLEALLEAPDDLGAGYRERLLAELLEGAREVPEVDAIRQALKAGRAGDRAPPAELQATLRDYQRAGLAWLHHLEQEGLHGILADDMGLGKTLQTLALVLLDPPDSGPTLVVAPTSVLENWRQEARRFAPSLPVRLYHGSQRSLEPPAGRQLVITSYALLRLDQERLAQPDWHRLILDEAQAIKNPDSQVAQAARRIPARHRLVLTGTPIENRLQELWSLLEFLNPGLLGSRRRFEDTFTRPAAEGDPHAIARLRARVQPFVLRRLKRQVARELPPKTEVVLRAQLSREERRVYDALRISGRSEVQRLLKTGRGAGRLQILEILLRLRQACCHPGLVPGGEGAALEGSSKVRLLLEQLETILAEGHKALVFSQWTGLLDRVEPALRQAGIDFVRLDGSTRDRAEVVASFQSQDGPAVFLISLKAGGTGLNLTAADYVFHLDPWWNPAVEEQAIDRAYRIGQTRPVVAVRLVAGNTIEERVLKLQARKRAVSEAALGGETGWVETLSSEELDILLSE